MSQVNRPSRQQRANRAHQLRQRGYTWEQIADTWEADYPTINPRIAFRWAHNLTHQDISEIWNEYDPGQPTMTKARIFQFEHWPTGNASSNGRRPSVANLEMLARIFCTSARRLLADGEYALYDNMTRTEIGSIDFRHLDDNQMFDSGAISSSTVPVMGVGDDSVGDESGEDDSGIAITPLQVARRAKGWSQGRAEDRESPNIRQIESLRRAMSDSLGGTVMSDANLEEWERIAIRYARATRDRSARVLLGDIGCDLAEVNRLAPQQRSVSSSRRLIRVAAQMSGLICLALCILDDRSAFRGWARTAVLAGNEAGDPETLSWIFAQESYGHFYSGDIGEAIDVARRARELVRVPCVGAALASALEARAHAIMGRDAETRSALAEAESVLSQLDGENLIPSAFGYNEASFRFHEGNAYTHLGDVDAAIRAQDRALDLCSPDNYADWAMTRLDRAQCLIRSGDIESGLEYAAETISILPEPQRQGIIALRGWGLVETLPEKEKKLARVHGFRELLVATSGKQ